MFWEELTGIKILERNVARLEGLELNQVRKFIKIFKQARKELVNRLLITPDNTYTEAKLETALSQIDQALIALEQRLKPELSFGFETLHEQGVEDAGKEINRFEKHFNGVTGLIPIDPLIEATDPENFLFNQFQVSVNTYSLDLRKEFQRVLGQSLLQQKTWTQAVNDMENVFAANEYKLARIVRTELHQIYNVSKLNGFKRIQTDYLPDVRKTLYHPMDIRTAEDSKTAAQKNLIVDLDKPFVYTFKQGDKDITRRFMTPPDRPNDRSILLPYRSSYDAKSANLAREKSS